MLKHKRENRKFLNNQIFNKSKCWEGVNIFRGESNKYITHNGLKVKEQFQRKLWETGWDKTLLIGYSREKQVVVEPLT